MADRKGNPLGAGQVATMSPNLLVFWEKHSREKAGRTRLCLWSSQETSDKSRGCDCRTEKRKR